MALMLMRHQLVCVPMGKFFQIITQVVEWPVQPGRLISLHNAPHISPCLYTHDEWKMHTQRPGWIYTAVQDDS